VYKEAGLQNYRVENLKGCNAEFGIFHYIPIILNFIPGIIFWYDSIQSGSALN
jgi:hypothetical protein